MGCVIIAACKRKKRSIFRKTVIKHIYYNNHLGGAEVIFLPYTEAEIGKMSGRRLTRLAQRTADMAGNNTAYCGIENLKRLTESYGVRYCDGAATVMGFIGELTGKIAENAGINIMTERVGVYDYYFCENTVDVVMDLSKCCEDIAVYTQNIEKAENMLDYVTENTGMPVVVTDNYSDWSKNCRIAVFMSDTVQKVGNNKMIGVDVFGRVTNDGIRLVRDIKFHICEDFCDIFTVTNGMKNQEMVEFIAKSGAVLKYGEDIRIAGYG